MACELAALVVFIALQPDPALLAPLYRQALAAREAELGPAHPKVARAASDLGLFLRNHGGPAGAAPFLRQALDIDEKALGNDSVVVGEDIENLASVLPPEEAYRLHVRAAAHPDAAIAARNLSKLGALEEARGNRDAARAFYRRALAKRESAVTLNAIALLSDPPVAEPLLRRALAMQEKAPGPRHPETAVTLNNLANVLLAQGRATQAEPLARRALSILESTLGPNHVRVATSASNLADVLRARKDYAGARKLYERALAIDEKAYGPAHPEVAVDRENLESLLKEMGLPGKP